MIYVLLAFVAGALVSGLSFTVGHNVGKTNSLRFPEEAYKVRMFSWRKPHQWRYREDRKVEQPCPTA